MDIKIGDTASFGKTITESDIGAFAGITGDFNAIHINEVEASNSLFGKRIAHGMISASLISTVIGTKLPGDGAVLLCQKIDYIKPVIIGDTITAICTVREIINLDKGIYKLETKCLNQDNDLVIDGEAVIKYKSKLKNVDSSQKKTDTFYTEEELKYIGIKKYGYNVKISRNAILYNPDELEVGNNVRIDDFTTISGKVVIGDYVHIAQFCGLYGGTKGIIMDDFSGLSARVVIYATSNDYSGESLTNPTVPMKYKKGDTNANVHLCKHVIVGTTSVVLPGVVIGEGCSIGAMSMISKDCDPWGIYVGCPTKRIKERSKNLLKLEDKLVKEQIFGGGYCKKDINQYFDRIGQVMVA